MSIVRREAGVGVLTQFVEEGACSDIQIIINLLLITFLMPCVNAILVIVKERGAKVAIARRLLTVAYYMLKRNQPYQENYGQPVPAARGA